MTRYTHKEHRDFATKEYLNDCFDYVDGRLFWKIRPVDHFKTVGLAESKNGIFAGKEAMACINNAGYAQGGVNNIIMLRRLAVWIMHHGTIPTTTIKSFNGDKTDDRIENLYEYGRREEFAGKYIRGEE